MITKSVVWLSFSTLTSDLMRFIRAMTGGLESLSDFIEELLAQKGDLWVWTVTVTGYAASHSAPAAQ